MIPEGCETNTESGTIRDRQHSLVTKLTKPTKTFASTGPAKAKAQHSPNENPIVLPDPEYRNVAGHVTRRQNAVRAEAPPTNTSRASSNLQNRRANWNEKQRRRTGNYDDDNSSGSDSDDRKKKQGDGGPSLKPRRQRTEPVEASHSGPSSLETEEKERLAIQKVLRRVSETWESVGWQRKQYQSQGSYRKRKLIQHHERDQGRRHRDLLRSLEGTHGAPREQALEDFKASSEDPATNTYFLGTGRLGVDIMTDAYLEKIIQDVAGAMRHDLAAGRKSPSTDGLSIPQIIRNSRHPNGPFTKEYMDWASVGIDPADVERACVELQQKAKSSRVQEFRDTMEDAKMPVEQIFIPDAIKDGKVPLVLFKGDYPSTVVEVDPEDLESMGWIWRSMVYAGPEWRVA
ncbi:hypothetical protein G7Z17_g51 [Cylindrodendrum hubeiense]|uniref:Uncharacterized protein n=1 Tax=Cylindrodendrum hubeiense TaxID=595255 RepID=A0A9P5HHG4_9HYPO|nr:hypothetical protein G7Z17_g51 [Cylindrodendrum hubeiense]